MHVSSQDKGQWRLKKKLVSFVFFPSFFFCHFMMVFFWILTSVLRLMPAKFRDKAASSHSLWYFLRTYSRSVLLLEFLRQVKPVLMSKTFKGAPSTIYSTNGSQWKMTTKLVPSQYISSFNSLFPLWCNLIFFDFFPYRDQRLHKLVFEEDGLPDGTEVAYYARGQVIEIKVIYFTPLYLCGM